MAHVLEGVARDASRRLDTLRAGARPSAQAFVDTGLVAAAEAGATGIEGFDDWARELVATGYVHNHALMWFASIWIFTLRLPLTLGADFFLRHLLDADAASNTLSWRWVAGLQTVGRHYLATTDNIARYTNGRFAPKGLTVGARALTEPPVELAQGLREPTRPAPGERSMLLVTHDDLHPESLFAGDPPIVAALVLVDGELLWGDAARSFAQSAGANAARRVAVNFGCPTDASDSLDAEVLISAARRGRAADRDRRRPGRAVGRRVGGSGARGRGHRAGLHSPGMDERFWPHAKKGYFQFKERLPGLLRAEGLL